MAKTIASPRWSITSEQWQSFVKSLWKYTAPLLLIFLIEVQRGTPIEQALVIVYAALLQVAINFLSKFATESK